MRCSVLLCLQCVSLLMLDTGALAAQDFPSASQSTVVRPMIDALRVPRLTTSAVRVAAKGDVPFPGAFVERLRVSSPSPVASVASARRRSRANGAILGGLIGAAAGALWGSIAPTSCCVPFGWSRGEAAVLWAAGGAGVGAVIGLVVSSSGGDEAASAAAGTVRPARTLVGVRIPLDPRNPVPR
jgi:hypothetical protein